jgi:stage II sporulation protein M
MKWRDLTGHMKEMKHYFIAAAITFLIGVFLGYTESERFLFFLREQSNQIRDIVEGINAKEHTQWWLLLFLFANNLMVSVLMVYSGVLFGFIPLFSLITNGLMLGYLANQNIPDMGWDTFALAILPHGIIEIPAIIIACAYGIKFGTLTAKGILFLPSPKRRLANNQHFLRLLKVSVPLLLLLCGLLLAAAIVESMITYNLVG